MIFNSSVCDAKQKGDWNRASYRTVLYCMHLFSWLCVRVCFHLTRTRRAIAANSEQGVEVDVIGYKKEEEKAYELDLDAGLIEVGPFDAISVVPKHNPTFHGIHKMPQQIFLESGNTAGAATAL